MTSTVLTYSLQQARKDTRCRTVSHVSLKNYAHELLCIPLDLRYSVKQHYHWGYRTSDKVL